MKKMMLFISLIVIYGFIGYFLHLPMAKLYFSGKTLFVSDVTATVVTQFKVAGIFILCGVIILTQIVLTKNQNLLDDMPLSIAFGWVSTSSTFSSS